VMTIFAKKILRRHESATGDRNAFFDGDPPEQDLVTNVSGTNEDAPTHVRLSEFVWGGEALVQDSSSRALILENSSFDGDAPIFEDSFCDDNCSSIAVDTYSTYDNWWRYNSGDRKQNICSIFASDTYSTYELSALHNDVDRKHSINKVNYLINIIPFGATLPSGTCSSATVPVVLSNILPRDIMGSFVRWKPVSARNTKETTLFKEFDAGIHGEHALLSRRRMGSNRVIAGSTATPETNSPADDDPFI
jgi:hypothetical protein